MDRARRAAVISPGMQPGLSWHRSRTLRTRSRSAAMGGATGGNGMLRRRSVLLGLAVAAGPLRATAQTGRDDQPTAYFPDAMWQHKAPSEAGMDPRLLEEAVAFAMANETKAPRDQVKDHYEIFGREPFSDVIGPMKDRGDPTGLVIRHGIIVAEWGDPRR